MQWIVNRSLLETFNLNTDIIIKEALPDQGESLSINDVPLHFNGTTVQCAITFLPDYITASSNIATLTVIGKLIIIIIIYEI